ncbi:hypothetical protein CAPSP0001_0501 [Capnocytophaga sputigena ATCC 33612]|nr:hypothetical protein CAPSP0001_0501 [Capnocytophaga sputigena ATCC 33612]
MYCVWKIQLKTLLLSHKIKQTKKMKSLKDKVKDFIMYLFDSEAV